MKFNTTMRHHLPTLLPPLATLLLLTIAVSAMAKPLPNITALLATRPQFATFNYHLTATGLAALINNRTETTVCALDNAAMSDLLSLNPSPTSLKRILSFNLFSHSDPQALYSCCAWTLCLRPSRRSFDVVDIEGGENSNISFTFPFTTLHSDVISFLEYIQPNLLVVHVNKPLPSPEYWSLVSPIPITKIFTDAGCESFIKSLAEVEVADKWFRENTYAGMTALCPLDTAWEKFRPRFEKLGEEEKIVLLLYHAISDYHNKCSMRGDLSEFRQTTLASNYKCHGGLCEIAVGAVLQRLIVGVAYDEGPLAVYPIKGVLLPDDPIGYVEELSTGEVQALELELKLQALEDVPGCKRWFPDSYAPAPEPEAADVDLNEVGMAAAGERLARRWSAGT